MGETIVNLTDTIRVLGDLVAASHPDAADRALLLAKEWFIELARSVPRKETQPFETQEQVGTRVLARILNAGGLPTDDTNAGRLLRHAWDKWQSQARLCEGVTKEWLRGIRTLSAGVGAVTDGDSHDVRTLLEKMGLESYFDSVTTSEDVRAYKPNPRVYSAALERLRARPERSLFVSDSSLDLQGAAKSGMGCALLDRIGRGGHIAVPEGTLHLHQPTELNPVLLRFVATGQFLQE